MSTQDRYFVEVGTATPTNRDLTRAVRDIVGPETGRYIMAGLGNQVRIVNLSRSEAESLAHIISGRPFEGTFLRARSGPMSELTIPAITPQLPAVPSPEARPAGQFAFGQSRWPIFPSLPEAAPQPARAQLPVPLQGNYRVEVRGLPGAGYTDELQQLVGFQLNNTSSVFGAININGLDRATAERAAAVLNGRPLLPGYTPMTAVAVDARTTPANLPAPFEAQAVRTSQTTAPGPLPQYHVRITGIPPEHRGRSVDHLVGFHVNSSYSTPDFLDINYLPRYMAEQVVGNVNGRIYPGTTNITTATIRPGGAAHALPEVRPSILRSQISSSPPRSPVRPSLVQEQTRGRRYILVEEASSLIRSGEVTQSIVDPENQREVPLGLARITLIGVDGHEYDVLARYDSQTQQISPPQ